jgi:D-tyrosyl-tRNA(Tyr) deacylase
MRILVQRVIDAEVRVNNEVVGKAEKGLLLFVGLTHEDTLEKLDWIVNKIINLRVFEDQDGKMNLSVKDIEGSILSVSQFTLYGDVKKGFRPSFTNAMEPNKAKELFDTLNDKLNDNIHTETGVFGEEMKVDFTNDGPVTILIEK